MDRATFDRARQSVEPANRARFDAVVNSLISSGELAGMSPAQQANVINNIAGRYGAGVSGDTGLSAAAGSLGGMLSGGTEGGGVSNLGTGPTSGVLGGPGADSTIGRNLAEAAGSYGKKAAVGGLAGLAQGASLGDVLAGVASPTAIAGVVGTGIGKGIMESMGFSTQAVGALEKVGLGALSAGLAMVNPALGIAASVLGKPAIELASDWMDTRTAEEDLDKIEDTYGKVKGMQLTKDLMNQVNLEKYMPEDVDKTTFGFEDALAGAQRELSLEQERIANNPQASVDNLQSLQQQRDALAELDALAKGTSTKTPALDQRMPQKQSMLQGTRDTGGSYLGAEADKALEDYGRQQVSSVGPFGGGSGGGGEHSSLGGGMSAGGEYGGSSSTQGGHDVGENMQA